MKLHEIKAKADDKSAWITLSLEYEWKDDFKDFQGSVKVLDVTDEQFAVLKKIIDDGDDNLNEALHDLKYNHFDVPGDVMLASPIEISRTKPSGRKARDPITVDWLVAHADLGKFDEFKEHGYTQEIKDGKLTRTFKSGEKRSINMKPKK